MLHDIDFNHIDLAYLARETLCETRTAALFSVFYLIARYLAWTRRDGGGRDCLAMRFRDAWLDARCYKGRKGETIK